MTKKVESFKPITMKQEKIKVVIGQLGSPKTPHPQDVRSFLKEFLSDPRVIDLPKLVWFPILYFFVLPFRPKKSAKAYQRIWSGKSFPLIENTENFAKQVACHLDQNIELDHAFLLSSPKIGEIFDEWEKEDFKERAQEVYILPQFPQYAESTIASVVDILGKDLSHRVNIPHFSVIDHYHNMKAFIDLSAKKIQSHVKEHQNDHLVISFHGIPTRRVTHKKDLYFSHCLETFELLRKKLNLTIPIHLCFQSRFGSEIWLGPATDEYAINLVKKSQAKNLAFYCPSFVVDCLETTDEIGYELGEEIKSLGADSQLIPCLNDDVEWAQAYADYINTLVNGSREQLNQLFYEIDISPKVKVMTEEQASKEAPKLSAKSKSTLKLMFLTMFLDLIGFSIIFPMFPALAKYYLKYDSDNFILKSIFSLVSGVQSLGGTTSMSDANTIILFGGILGALYSFLQFCAAPLWGSLSDRVGRKPVLVISVFGLFISYVLWFFSRSFTLLALARVIGGVMSGNLSIASAVVADVTDEKNRSKGMVYIGIAFAFGFIIGPALGGLASLVDLSKNQALFEMGINPFSFAALIAGLLSLLNFFVLITKFQETLPVEKRGLETVKKTHNPLKLFAKLPYQGVNQTNLAYFLFISAFSGMEFTLTFLAVERLGYSSMDNAYMFIFIGLIIGLVQGGFVRRKAFQIGEAKVAALGLFLTLPGLILTGNAHSGFVLYSGLLFLAMGSAMIIPCLTSLVSIYTPSSVQGRVLGVFRGLGSLGRVIGPIGASLFYWRYGGLYTYLVGAAILVVPLLMVKFLPTPQPLSDQ